MPSYDITQIQLANPGAGNGVQTNILFRINSQPGLSNGNSVTFGMSSEDFSNDSFQLSNGQTLTIGNVDTGSSPGNTLFTLASGGTIFAANSAGSGEIQGYTGGSYVSGDFTITTGGGGGSGLGKLMVKGTGKSTIKGSGKITIK
jgi:hypothetical protein